VRLLAKDLSRCLTLAQQAEGGKETQEHSHYEDKQTLENARFVMSEIDTERYNN
jgi:hypothetical protein